MTARENIRNFTAKIYARSDRLFFLLSPSFYALVGGTTLSIAIDLFGTLVSIQTQIPQDYTTLRPLAVLAILVSAGSFLFLSMKLEGLRTEVPMQKLLKLINNRRGAKRQLRLALLFGFLSLGFGLTALFLGYLMTSNQGVVDC